ncbi:MAG: MerR family transcriptional regulator [Bacteroidales bacterium]|nr:MerR family transcriptional regulator [Bacteroidales bacterium]
MPYKPPVIEKIYYSIGEVAVILQVTPSSLRYWEQEFPSIRPDKAANGKRKYTIQDIDKLKIIHHLVKERGMTIDGARRKLRENPDDTIANHSIVERLQAIRGMLLDLKTEMD